MRTKRVPARSARELEVKGKTEKRTKRESKRRKMGDLLVQLGPAKCLENGAAKH